MFLFTNAVKNIRRNLKKYSIFMIVVFLISFISFTSIIMIDSANSYLDEKKQEYGSIVSISLSDEFFSNMQPGQLGAEQDVEQEELTVLTDEDYESFAESEYVNSLLVETTVGVDYDEDTTLVGQTEIEEMQEEMESNQDGEEISGEQPNQGGQQAGGGFSQVSSSLIAYSDYSNLDYFLEESVTITDGDVPSTNTDILISSQLAELNDYEVGDSISVTSVNETTADYTVSGIYYSDDDTENAFSTNMIGANTSYVTTDSLSQFGTTQGPGGTTSEYLYLLNSYEDFDNFNEELQERGLDENYELTYPSDDLSNVITPLENLLDVVQIYLISTFIIGGLILVFIVQLNLKGRKFEIGILRALNYSRGKLVLSFIVELVVSSLIAAVFALVFVFAFAAPISENVINSQLTQTTTENGPGANMGQRGGFSNVDMEDTNLEASDIAITYSPTVILYTFILIEGLVVLSSIYGLSFVYKSNPNKILRERV